MAKWLTDNPAPHLFTTFERVENCHRVEVTEENLHVIAKHFGWRVAYDFSPAELIGPAGERKAEVGSWIDYNGSRWNPDPLSQGWSPAGTFTSAPAPDHTNGSTT